MVNFNLAVILGLAGVIVVSIILMSNFNSKTKSKILPKEMVIEPVNASEKLSTFYIYSYYNVPVTIKAVLAGDDKEDIIAENIPSSGKALVSVADHIKYFIRGTIIRVYDKLGSLITESIINTPPNRTITAYHVGLSAGQDDLSMAAGDNIRFGLGIALPRLRIVNMSSKTLCLSIGSENLSIRPNTGTMYSGEFANGLPMGTIIRDNSGVLKDYRIEKPITDLFMGFASDIATPLYVGAKYGMALDDTVDMPNHLPQMFSHAYMIPKRDNTFIP